MINRRRYLLSAFATLLSAQTVPPRPISKNGLIKALKTGGLTPTEFVQQINQRGVNFSVTSDVEKELRRAGATPQVIEAARTHGPPPAAPAELPSVAPPPITVVEPPPAVKAPEVTRSVPATKPGVYMKKNGSLQPLPPESVTWRKPGGFRKLTGTGREMMGSVPGESSPALATVPATFVLVTSEGQNAAEFQLLLLRKKGGIRETRVNSTEANPMSVSFQPHKTGDHTFEVDFSQGAGEYGFLPPSSSDLPSHIYTFRVQ